MTSKTVKAQAIDLGRLQAEFETRQREWHATERALARAQEARDMARSKAQSADNALRDATRTVLG